MLAPRYLRMIRGMKNKRQPRAKREWSVYILSCEDGSLYTGVAKDAQARFEQHRLGKGAAYTRSHRPVDLVYQKKGLTRVQALVREAEIKYLPRSRKDSLITGRLTARRRDAGRGKKRHGYRRR